MKHKNMSSLNNSVLDSLKGDVKRYLPLHSTYQQQSLTDRIRRSISWLERALEVSSGSTPTRFLDLWISLNALYGQRPYNRQQSSHGKRDYGNSDFKFLLKQLRRLDHSCSELFPLMKRVEKESRILVENKFLYKGFWKEDLDDFKLEFSRASDQLQRSLGNRNPVEYFGILFQRLRILRNQIAHGSSSVNTKKSQDALMPGLKILEEMISIFVRLMITKGMELDWPEIPYPGRDTPQHPRGAFQTKNKINIL